MSDFNIILGIDFLGRNRVEINYYIRKSGSTLRMKTSSCSIRGVSRVYLVIELNLSYSWMGIFIMTEISII